MKTEDAVVEILKNIGEDPTRVDLIETPRRIAKSHEELFSGYNQNAAKAIKKFDANGYKEMILVKDIEYFSMCEHHMIPFFGKASVAYIPNKHITGLSKIPRILDIFARRLQNQERLTMQVANTLFEELDPKGVAVQISGKHLCMCGRGANKASAETITTCFLGEFKTDPNLKSDFFSQIKTG